MNPTTPPLLHFRPGEEGDQPRIAEMTREIWEGQDYLAKVWHEWVHEPNSRLEVGLLGEEIVASGRIIELTPGNWWLEGLRVNPAYQGQRLATRLHEHLVELALQQPGIRTLGLATSANNEKVAHLALQSGMELRGEYRFLKGPAAETGAAGVERLVAADLPALLERLRASEWVRQSEGHLMDGWVTRPLTLAWLQELDAAGGLWRCGEAVALTGGGSHGDQTWLYLAAGGEEGAREALARHARHLAHERAPGSHLRCFCPLEESLQRPLFAAGLHDADDGEFRVRHFARYL